MACTSKRQTEMTSQGWYAERFEDRCGRLQFDCISCAKPMWFPKSKHGKYLTCSTACADKVRMAHRAELERKCSTCGSSFLGRREHIKAGRSKFCSQACNTAGLAAINAPHAKAKSVASRKKNIKDGSTVLPTGSSNKRWHGGLQATRQRRQENGRARAEARSYYARNKDKAREKSIRRHGMCSQPLPQGTVKRLGASQRWKCAACAVDIRKQYHLDHIVALSKGGKHDPINLQLLCPRCNVRKSAKHPVEFMQEMGFLL